LAAPDTGVGNGAILIAFADAVVADDKAALGSSRRQIADAMGEAALVDAAGVAAYFNGIDRIADATGTPVDPASAEATTEMRAALGIDKFYEVKRALDDMG
jgi:hypothetical protein